MRSSGRGDQVDADQMYPEKRRSRTLRRGKLSFAICKIFATLLTNFWVSLRTLYTGCHLEFGLWPNRCTNTSFLDSRKRIEDIFCRLLVNGFGETIFSWPL